MGKNWNKQAGKFDEEKPAEPETTDEAAAEPEATTTEAIAEPEPPKAPEVKLIEPGNPITAGAKFATNDSAGKRVIYTALEDPALHNSADEPQYPLTGYYLKCEVPGCPYPVEIPWDNEKHQPRL